MALLNKQLKAGSLLECIVAAIIMMVCFAITMDTLTRVTLTSREDGLEVVIEMALKQKYQEYQMGGAFPGQYKTEYDWGVLEVEVTDYNVQLQQLVMIAQPLKGNTTIRYDCLIPK